MEDEQLERETHSPEPVPYGTLAFILVYMAVVAVLWVETYLRLYVPRGQ
jgi:hypothetical protein